MNAAVTSRLNVVLHVSDEQGLLGRQEVFLQDFVNLFPLVPDVEVGLVEVLGKAGGGGLDCEVLAMDGAQQEGPELVRSAEFQELAGVRQRTHRILDLPEPAVKPIFQLRQGNMWNVPVVEDRKRQAKFGAELLERQLRPLGPSQDVVGRLPNGWQVVH